MVTQMDRGKKREPAVAFVEPNIQRTKHGIKVPPKAGGEFQGKMVAAAQPRKSALGKDPKLKVAPTVSAADSIKEQLGDIKGRLHKASNLSPATVTKMAHGKTVAPAKAFVKPNRQKAKPEIKVPPEAGGKFQGAIVAPTQPHKSALGIDPNCMVGPLCVPRVSVADNIKTQLETLYKEQMIVMARYDLIARNELTNAYRQYMLLQMGYVCAPNSSSIIPAVPTVKPLDCLQALSKIKPLDVLQPLSKIKPLDPLPVLSKIKPLDRLPTLPKVTSSGPAEPTISY